jgi:cellulose biosynthesis protein BcsQ
MDESTLALVGATGGAGTTRLAVEMAATLARADRDVVVLDAAYATQGLAGYVSGRIDPDVTTLATGEGVLERGLVDLPVDLPGRAALCPARAPFERIARAKTAGAAQRFEELVSEAAAMADHVVVDTPPVAANQSVAAATRADRVALVAPATRRGADALPRIADRLVDLDTDHDLVVGTRATGSDALERADIIVPESEVTGVEDAPTCLRPDGTFAPAVAAVCEAAFETSLDLSFPEPSLVDRYLPNSVRES